MGARLSAVKTTRMMQRNDTVLAMRFKSPSDESVAREWACGVAISMGGTVRDTAGALRRLADQVEAVHYASCLGHHYHLVSSELGSLQREACGNCGHIRPIRPL